MQVREGDDLDQGLAAAVEVDQGCIDIVLLCSCSVLFQLHLLDIDSEGSANLQSIFHGQDNLAILGQWVVVLSDLIASGLVVVEVVFAVEGAHWFDGTS
jgi:hypothetical protein